ncbi:MAG: hypothetical protein KGH56_03915 [Patescibacteria group bacterium]|nr:hypothetical protein [Patescibacteria group bacterium]
MKMRLMGMFLALCFLSFSFGCLTKEQREDARTPRKPEVYEWGSYDTFVTVKEVQKIDDGLNVGYVVVERRSDSSRFSVQVAPYQEIRLGSQVRVKAVRWEKTRAQRLGPEPEFLIAKL